MKKLNYWHILKSRGYRPLSLARYNGTCHYVKEHLFNKVLCNVSKDSHGKGVAMMFQITDGGRAPKNMTEFFDAEFDRSYLTKEAKMIYARFESLRDGVQA